MKYLIEGISENFITEAKDEKELLIKLMENDDIFQDLLDSFKDIYSIVNLDKVKTI